MATRRLLTHPRTHPPLVLLSRSSSSAALSSPSLPRPAAAPASPPVLPYDRLAAAVRSKIDRLSDPDPRFLRFASPHPTLSDHSPILSLPPTRVTTLPNGVRVATESALACPTAAVGVWIDAGSRFEPEDASGVARLVERLVVNGSDKLREELASYGGCIEGFTGREMTVFKTRVVEKGVSKALEIVADLVQNPRFDEGAVKKERDAMIRELEADEQTEELLFNHLHATAFQYTPLGRTVSGSAQSIKTITVDHLKSYISTHYTGPRVVISAAGAVKHDDIVEQVKKLFPKLTADSFTAAQLVMKEPTAFTGSEVRIIDDDIPLAKFAVAFNGASLKDPDYLALMVMKTMLGSWNKSVSGGKHAGSTLVEKIAIDEIAESIAAFNLSYKDAGLFGVYAVAKPDCLDDLAYAIMYDISKLSYRVSEDDVTRARNQLKSSLQRHLDGTSAVAEDIGYQLLKYGRRIPTAELFARIDAVDAVAVKRVANRFIFDQDIAIAASGPIQSLPDYNWFRRRTYMNRY